MKRSLPIWCCVTLVALPCWYHGGPASPALGAEYQWDFAGSLNGTLGSGTLTYADASTESLTMFKTTDGLLVPHIGGEPASYMHVPAFSQLSEGYNLELTATGPNGGGAYVNQYTMVLDLYVPGELNWIPLYNTNFDNANDADMYLAWDGSVGIAGLGYSDINVIAANTWYRLAFAVDLAAGRASYFVNGSPVFDLAGPPLLDERMSLYSNVDPGHDLRLFNEGDDTGEYTHDVYVSSLYLTDRELSASEIAALGGPTAGGIVELKLEGDYNGDRVVNAADYIVWRNTFGQIGVGLAADGNGNEEVDTDDYAIWKGQYGQTTQGGLLHAPGTPVPEPRLMGIWCIAFALWAPRSRSVYLASIRCPLDPQFPHPRP